MFKDHPKGLFVAFFANMGERFGYYTMIAIFVLFIQAKYGMDSSTTSQIYGIFVAFVYFFPMLGGLIADKLLGYGKTVSIGLVVMFAGYLLLAIPSGRGEGLWLVFCALAVIALGTGLFKGNLQALVGNMYDDPRYGANRDRAFNIFYMGINIGAMFAPTAASRISNWILGQSNFTYDARIPALANSLLEGKLENTSELLQAARLQDAAVTIDSLKVFSEKYISVLSESYHYAFGVACISLIISMLVYWGFRRHYAHAVYSEKQKAKDASLKSQVVELTPEQTRSRLFALFLVFGVVIFFWMSFHQNGLTQTWFARDYTRLTVDRLNNLLFDLFGLLPVFFAVLGAVFLVRKNSTPNIRLLGAAAAAGFSLLAWYQYHSYNDTNAITPQIFQQFNPFFIVALTPIVVAIFGWLNKKGKEPSAPRKIGFGMLLAAGGFLFLMAGSFGLPSPASLHEQVAPADMLVSPHWLIWTYFILTVSELLLSPMGISFVSKVAPPKYKGLMQGCWFAATGVGNYLLAIIGYFWTRVPVWGTWAILVTCCLLSAGFIFIMMKRLEKASQS